MQNRDAVLNKIRKIMNLSQSTNQHEASIALRQAQKLMHQYNVTFLDLETSLIKQTNVVSPSNATNPPEWLNALIALINKVMGTKAFLDWHSEKHCRIVTFYGLEEKPELAAYAFNSVGLHLKKAVTNYLLAQPVIQPKTKRARAANFRLGFVLGLYNELETFSMRTTESKLLDDFKKKKELIEVNTQKTTGANGSLKARKLGFDEGKNIKILSAIAHQRGF